jgi:hypothetical protein
MTSGAFKDLLRRQSEQESPEFRLPGRKLAPVLPLPTDYEEIQTELASGSVPLQVVR